VAGEAVRTGYSLFAVPLRNALQAGRFNEKSRGYLKAKATGHERPWPKPIRRANSCEISEERNRLIRHSGRIIPKGDCMSMDF